MAADWRKIQELMPDLRKREDEPVAILGGDGQAVLGRRGRVAALVVPLRLGLAAHGDRGRVRRRVAGGALVEGRVEAQHLAELGPTSSAL